jgi:hypothetical protein
LPINAADSIGLALEHTKRQLFRPFQIGQWTKLALVGMLAGELGSKGCKGSNFQLPGHPGLPNDVPHEGLPGALGIDPTLLAAISAVLGAVIVVGLVIGLILMYVGSVMRFVLFDSILARECHIRWSWNRRAGIGWQYFIWKFLYFLLVLAGIAIVAGIPLAIAFAKGWLSEPREHLPALVFGGVFIFLAVMVLAVATAVILVLTKDFVVPQMALENISAMEGWRRLWLMMQAEKGAYAGYIGLKIVLAIVAGIIIGIATVILGLIFVVPTVGLSLLAILTGQSAGWTWNAHTIFLAVAVGTILLAAFLYLVSLISVPAIVFFPAYSMYFFAGRYPRLAAALYPAPPAVSSPAMPSR